MNTQTEKPQKILLSQNTYLPILAESFLVDRKSQGLTPGSIGFYQMKLKIFLKYCEAQVVTQLEDVTPDFLRHFILTFSESHKPGGVHAVYRAVRAFLLWVEHEEIVSNWKNPISKVKAPRLPTEPLEPVSLEDISAMLKVCESRFAGLRDRAILLMLLDTGVRASELLNINLDDLEIDGGSVLIRMGKGRKPRLVVFARKTRRAIRAYLKLRDDQSPALWVISTGERLTYGGLRSMIIHRSRQAGLKKIPSPHDFRRQFALSMLRNGVDVFSLQKLMGHTDLQVLRRYLAQTDQDIRAAHARGSPTSKV